MMAMKDPEYLTRIYDQMRELCEIVENVGSEIDGGLGNKKVKLKAKLTEQCMEAQIKEEQTVEMCIEALIRHQPFARDLRAVSAAMKVSYDLSRICRYLRNISEVLEEFNIKCEDPDLLPLYRKAWTMIQQSMEAYFGKDAKAAAAIIAEDEVVDEGYRAILHKYAASTTTSGGCTLFNGITARIIERMADHASYISHETIYLATGRRVDYR
jgi:phosphate transport system protein